MAWLHLIGALLCSGFGIYLFVMAMLWRSRGIFTRAETIGFLKKTSRGKKLPVFKFDDESAIEVTSRAVAIDSIGYWLKPPQKGEMIDILYFKQDSEKCIVHGYMNILAAFFLQWPLIFYFSANYFSDIAQGRFGFLFVLFCVVGLMWLFMRIVRHHY